MAETAHAARHPQGNERESRMTTTTREPVFIGHTKDEAAVRRIETAARVRVTLTHDLRQRAYRVTAATEADASAFRSMAEHLGLPVCY